MSDEYLKMHEQILQEEDKKINCLIFSVLLIAVLLIMNTYHNLYQSFDSFELSWEKGLDHFNHAHTYLTNTFNSYLQ